MVVMKNLEEDQDFFAREIARKICGDNDQNAMIICVGKPGSGKSWSMIQLARKIAYYISLKKGGNLDDYFKFEENVGIMNWENIEKVFEKMDAVDHQVFIADDFGAAYNARKFNSDENVAMNDRFQTMRPRSNVFIVTTPNQMLIDKVLRYLASYMIFMRDPLFSLGYGVADIRKIEIVPNDPDPRYVYLQNFRGEKYREHLISAPPKEITDLYRKMRQEASDKLNAQSRATIEAKMKPKEPKESKTSKSIKLHKLWKDGTYGDMPFREVCEENGINYNSAKVAVSEFKG